MRKLKKYIDIILLGGLLLTIAISNAVSFVRDGRSLDRLRDSVLRLHILADSDSEEDQALKLLVRDAILENSSDIFGDADSLEEAESAAGEKLPEIIALAEKTLRSHGCGDRVTAEIADVEFDERVYGDITMPAGTYRALRIKIGKAEGHNWWCVMYPPLCLPAAREVVDDKDAEEEFFTEKERDILYKPQKYRLRFAIWDKIKSIID